MKLNKANVENNLKSLREFMKKNALDALWVSASDPHDSEYFSLRWRTREWLSGFTGSAGTLVVTQSFAGLWTDGRYFLQAQNQLAGTGIELMKDGMPETPTQLEWFKKNLSNHAVLGLEGSTTVWQRFSDWQEELQPQGIKLVTIPELFDSVWTDRPKEAQSRIWDYQAAVDIPKRTEKIATLRKMLESKGAQAHLVCPLDESAWLLNLRGDDVSFNPVFYCYTLVEQKQVTLFTALERLDDLTVQALRRDGVEVRNYEEIFDVLAAWPKQEKLLLAPDKTNLALIDALKKSSAFPVVWAKGPCGILKAVKSSSELALTRKAMKKDAVALVEFLAWFHTRAPLGGLTELAAAQKLEDFRKEQGDYRGASFEPIPGFRENGAVVHYKVEQGEGAVMDGHGLFLLDTGAQYLEGTTDVTRTMTVGKPNKEEKQDYTLVLKAHVQIALTPFVVQTRGYTIDAFARQVLWKNFRQFNHGTGHGVGHYLCVHEGPQRINSEPLPTALVPGMILSDEPGLYLSGRYGIRIENLLAVQKGPQSEFADFLTWETLTLCPYERALIDIKLLDWEERDWINHYHQRVWSELKDIVTPPARNWLKKATRPL